MGVCAYICQHVSPSSSATSRNSSALSPATARARTPSASIAGMKHARWSILWPTARLLRAEACARSVRVCQARRAPAYPRLAARRAATARTAALSAQQLADGQPAPGYRIRPQRACTKGHGRAKHLELQRQRGEADRAARVHEDSQPARDVRAARARARACGSPPRMSARWPRSCTPGGPASHPSRAPTAARGASRQIGSGSSHHPMLEQVEERMPSERGVRCSKAPMCLREHRPAPSAGRHGAAPARARGGAPCCGTARPPRAGP